MVDLDGARSGTPRSLEHLRRIVSETGVPVQYGGGLRTLAAVREALRAGAERVIVGTAAFRDVDFLDSVIAAFGPRVLVSVDVRGGHISTAGWTQTTQMPAGDAIRRLGDRGVTSFVYTDVDRDGRLEGPDLDDVRRVAESVRGRFLYSGGIGRLEHLRALAELRQVNLAGVIVGKALYEGRFTVAEGQAALDSERPPDGYSRPGSRRTGADQLPASALCSRRHARKAAVIAATQAAPSTYPASTSETKWTPSETRAKPMASTQATPAAAAIARHAPWSRGSASRPSTQAATIADWACPLGKLRPFACATGLGRTGRARCTASLTSALSAALPAVVTTTKIARRGRPLRSSHTATSAKSGR